jgi:hypothetical protein
VVERFPVKVGDFTTKWYALFSFAKHTPSYCQLNLNTNLATHPLRAVIAQYGKTGCVN